VWEGLYAEASERLAWLEEAHIPVDLGDALLPGQARVEVPPEYAAEAREIMQRGPGSTSSIPLLDPSAPWFTGWKIAVAVLIVVAIVIAYVL
jgi:hypothetical protein